MATRKTRAAASEPSEPAKLKVSVDAAASKLAERIELGEQLAAEPINSLQTLEDHEARYTPWHEFNVEMLRRMFTNEEEADRYRAYSGSMFITMATQGRNIGKEIRDHQENVRTKVARLKSLQQRLELFDVENGVTQAQPPQSVYPAGVAAHSDRVFIVHGHNHGKRDAVRALVQQLGLKPIVLEDELNGGRTIIEKFEETSDAAGYAIVLMTSDDVGGTDATNLKPRARQNVVLELGYFVGKLKRKRVCALHEPNVEMPSDINGVGYITLDTAGAWKFQVARELKGAGYNIDLNVLC